MRRTSMFFGDEQYERMERISKRTGIGSSELVRRAVDFYLSTDDRFRALGLPMGDLDALLNAVRKEEREKLEAGRTIDAASLDRKLNLLLAKLEKLAPGEFDVE